MRKLHLVVTCMLVLAACEGIPGTGGGVIQGVVYTDLDGDGIGDPGEGPLQGVDVQLSGCGATALQTTGADGAFAFGGLPAGTCAGWTYPVAHANPQFVDLALASGKDASGVNFGWDFQFLPAAPVATPTPTPASASGGFSPPNFSAPIFYYRGGGCGSKTLDLGIQALGPAVRNVVAFFRLKGPDGQTDWSEGASMQAQGNGNYALGLDSVSIPGFTSFPRATLQVQFVAEGAAGEILARTPVYADVSLEICNR